MPGRCGTRRSSLAGARWPRQATSSASISSVPVGPAMATAPLEGYDPCAETLDQGNKATEVEIMPISKRLGAEFIGTFWLVLGGCGSAVLAAAFPSLGIGFLGVAFAFGLTVLTMAYAVGHISGGHFNPAVSVGLMVGKRLPASDLLGYIVAQVAGAIAGAGGLYVIATGKPGFEVGGFASNGFAEHSPGNYSMIACLVAEIVLTFAFLFIILG